MVSYTFLITEQTLVSWECGPGTHRITITCAPAGTAASQTLPLLGSRSCSPTRASGYWCGQGGEALVPAPNNASAQPRSPPVGTNDSFNVAVPTRHDNGSIHHSRTVQKYQSHAIAAPGQYSGSAQSPSLRARKQSTPSPTTPTLPPPHCKGRPRSNLAGYLRGVHASPFLRTKCSSSFPDNFSA